MATILPDPSTMQGTFDLGNNEKAILLALLSKLEGYPYNPDEYIFNHPQALIGTNMLVTDKDGQQVTRNTKIEIQPLAETGNHGAKVLFYNRMLAESLNLKSMPYNGEISTHQLIPRLNSRYALGITQDMVIDAPIESPAPGASSVPVVFSFHPQAVLFTGSVAVNMPIIAPGTI